MATASRHDLPMSPAQAIRLFESQLTPYELAEILACKSVFYLGTEGPHSQRISTSEKAAAIASSQGANNDSFDTAEGEYARLVPGDHLHYRYEIISTLGAGSFGQVVRCFDHCTQTEVAVKLVRNRRRYRQQAEIELQLLRTIRDAELAERSASAVAAASDASACSALGGAQPSRTAVSHRVTALAAPGAVKVSRSSSSSTSMTEVGDDPSGSQPCGTSATAAAASVRASLPIDHHIIHVSNAFMFRHHLCLVFPLGGMDLYSLLKRTGFRGLSLNLVRRFAAQMLEALCFLDRLDIVHADLKPENFVLRSNTSTGAVAVGASAAPPTSSSIDLIDLGSGCKRGARIYTYIQSRFYRAPETILNLPYSCPIDLWSLGVMLPELLTGRPLFPGGDEGEMLLLFQQVLGLPPASMLAGSPRASKFYQEDGGPRSVEDRRGRRREPGSRTLGEAVLRMRVQAGGAATVAAAAAEPGMSQFLAFLGRLLVWDPDKRPTPLEAARDPWIAALMPASLFAVPASPSSVAPPDGAATASSVAGHASHPMPASHSSVSSRSVISGDAGPPHEPAGKRGDLPSPRTVAAASGAVRAAGTSSDAGAVATAVSTSPFTLSAPVHRDQLAGAAPAMSAVLTPVHVSGPAASAGVRPGVLPRGTNPHDVRLRDVAVSGAGPQPRLTPTATMTTSYPRPPLADVLSPLPQRPGAPSLGPVSPAAFHGLHPLNPALADARNGHSIATPSSRAFPSEQPRHASLSLPPRLRGGATAQPTRSTDANPEPRTWAAGARMHLASVSPSGVAGGVRSMAPDAIVVAAPSVTHTATPTGASGSLYAPRPPQHSWNTTSPHGGSHIAGGVTARPVRGRRIVRAEAAPHEALHHTRSPGAGDERSYADSLQVGSPAHAPLAHVAATSTPQARHTSPRAAGDGHPHPHPPHRGSGPGEPASGSSVGQVIAAARASMRGGMEPVHEPPGLSHRHHAPGYAAQHAQRPPATSWGVGSALQHLAGLIRVGSRVPQPSPPQSSGASFAPAFPDTERLSFPARMPAGASSGVRGAAKDEEVRGAAHTEHEVRGPAPGEAAPAPEALRIGPAVALPHYHFSRPQPLAGIGSTDAPPPGYSAWSRGGYAADARFGRPGMPHTSAAVPLGTVRPRGFDASAEGGSADRRTYRTAAAL